MNQIWVIDSRTDRTLEPWLITHFKAQPSEAAQKWLDMRYRCYVLKKKQDRFQQAWSVRIQNAVVANKTVAAKTRHAAVANKTLPAKTRHAVVADKTLPDKTRHATHIVANQPHSVRVQLTRCKFCSNRFPQNVTLWNRFPRGCFTDH